MQKKLGRKLSSNEDVHHINEDKTDDRLENLEIKTILVHASHHSTGNKPPIHKGKRPTNAKLTTEQVAKCRELYRTTKLSQEKIAEIIGTSQSTVSYIVNNYYYCSPSLPVEAEVVEKLE